MTDSKFVVLYVDLKGTSNSYPSEKLYRIIMNELNEFFKQIIQQNDELRSKVNSIVYDKSLGDAFLCAFDTSNYINALAIAVYIQLFSKYYNKKKDLKRNSSEKPVSFNIVIDLDYMQDITVHLTDNPLLNHAYQTQKEYWGDAFLDAIKISQFAMEDQILIRDEYYEMLTSKTLKDLGMASDENINDKFQYQLNYEKDGRISKVYSIAFKLNNDDLSALIGNAYPNPQTFASENESVDVGKHLDRETTGILVRLANEKPILKIYYDGIVEKYKIHITAYDRGTYRLQHKEANKIYEYLYGISDYYQATTALLPSEYNNSYWPILNYHTALATKKDTLQENIRFIVHNKQDLKKDYLTYEDEWNKFLSKHRDNEGNELIKVLWVDKEVAEKIRYEQFAILKSIDLGVWKSNIDDYSHCAQWELKQLSHDTFEGEFWLTSKKEDGLNYFDNAQGFLNALKSKAKPIEELIKEAQNEKERIHDRNLFVFSQSIAQNWKYYLNPLKRRDVLKRFITPILEYYFGKDFGNRQLTILDASSGIGCDAVEMKELSPKSNVYFNESSLHLNKKAKEWLANESGTDLSNSITVTSTPWDLLDIRYRKISFDFVLVLGNFISRGKNLDTIRDYLIRFKSLMSKNGILIVDHRNYFKIKGALTTPERYFEDFVTIHGSDPGLYQGFGQPDGYYTWPVDVDELDKRITMQFGKDKNENSDDNCIRMSFFKNEDFLKILHDVFQECEIRARYDYQPPNLWDKTSNNMINVWASNFIIYIIYMKEQN